MPRFWTEYGHPDVGDALAISDCASEKVGSFEITSVFHAAGQATYVGQRIEERQPIRHARGRERLNGVVGVFDDRGIRLRSAGFLLLQWRLARCRLFLLLAPSATYP
jgi:hypothetical protein